LPIVVEEDKVPQMRDYIYLGAIAIGVTWIAAALAPVFFNKMMGIAPGLQVVLSESTWRILLITTIALLLSATPLSRLPNATAMGTALIYIFVAGMGARATIEGFGQAPAFLLGAFIWIFWSEAVPRRRPQRCHCVGSQYRRRGLGAYRRGIPPPEPGPGFGADGADRLRSRQLSCTAGRASCANCRRAVTETPS
jgi:hypothetical protein